MTGLEFYEPHKSYDENFKEGPFGPFSKNDRVVDEGEPQYEFLGQKVNLPFGIPAGPLLNGRFVKAALDKGFDICVYKTVRTRFVKAHPWPNILSVAVQGDLTLEKARLGVVARADYSYPLSITNSFGVPSQNPDFWQKDLAEAAGYAKKGQVVAASFQGTTNKTGDVKSYIGDFVLAAKLLKETGVKVAEVNLSCPNEGTSNLLCFDTGRSRMIVEAVKNELGNIPLIIKIGYFENENQLKDFISKLGPVAAGVASINTLVAEVRDKNGNQALPGRGRLRSGICGAAIKWAGLEMTKKLLRLRQEFNFKYTIISMGGVMEEADYLQYKDAGADAVMSATGAMWNSYLAQEIKDSRITRST